MHDILNIMTRNMNKSKKADVSAIYPLKGEHKKPEHVRPQSMEKQIVPMQSEQMDHDQSEQRDNIEPADIPDVVDLPKPNEVPIDTTPQKVPETVSGLCKGPDIYPPKMKRPSPLLEPSSYPQIMTKPLPTYEGLLKPQPIGIELRGRLPSYDEDKAIDKYPLTMDIPSIEELKEKKRMLLHKIPENTVFRRHISKQIELEKLLMH